MRRLFDAGSSACEGLSADASDTVDGVGWSREAACVSSTVPAATDNNADFLMKSLLFIFKIER